MFLEIELINIKKHEQILYQLGYQYDHASWTEDIEEVPIWSRCAAT